MTHVSSVCAADLLTQLQVPGLGFPYETQLRFCAVVFNMFFL